MARSHASNLSEADWGASCAGAGAARVRPNLEVCRRARWAWPPAGRLRHPRETRLELVERIGEAYGLVLLLILVTFAVMMTLPPEGWAAG